MMEAIAKTMGETTVGQETAFQNLALFPLLATGGIPETPGYLTLDEALAAKTARITEVSQGGSVPELLFVNDGALPVLILDGEELIGAKQNRTVNLTILVPAKTTLKLPVSCVEAGRWSHVSAEFAAAPRAHFAAGRAAKSAQVTANLKSRRSHAADQGAVWEGIAAKASRMGGESPTQAMAAIYERHETNVEEYVRALEQPAALGQVGALFALNGHIVGCDRFDHPATLVKLLPKIVRSHALDALDTVSRAKSNDTAARADAEAFLLAISRAEAQAFPALGIGEDARLSGAGVTGGALIADGRVVHLCAFRQDGARTSAADEAPSSTSLARASARRMHHR